MFVHIRIKKHESRIMVLAVIAFIVLFIIHNSLFIIPELIAKHLQLWYMRRHQTTELISDGVLAFHPKDYTRDVLTAFEKRVNEYAAKV